MVIPNSVRSVRSLFATTLPQAKNALSLSNLIKSIMPEILKLQSYEIMDSFRQATPSIKSPGVFNYLSLRTSSDA